MMKIILSPAKKMITDTDCIEPVVLPRFIDKTTELLSWLKDKSKEELKAIWKCNDKILEQNFHRLENMNLYQVLSLVTFIIMRIITIFIDNRIIVVYNPY